MVDRQALDRYITGNYGEDQESGPDEDEATRPLTPSAAIQASIFDLLRQRRDWQDREDEHGVLPWIEQRIAGLTQAQRDLDDLHKIKAALAVLKSAGL